MLNREPGYQPITRLAEERSAERDPQPAPSLLGQHVDRGEVPIDEVRTALRAYVERVVTPLQTGALFFVLAFGMILRWRIGMLLEYRRLLARVDPAGAPSPR